MRWLYHVVAHAWVAHIGPRWRAVWLIPSVAVVAATGVVQAGPEERRVTEEFRRVVDRALETTERVEHADMRATLFAQIAEAQVQAGESHAARASLVRARSAAGKVPDPDTTWLRWYFGALIPATAEYERRTLYRDIVFERIGKASARAGEFPQALEAAQEIRDVARRIGVLVEAAAAGYRKSLALALETAEGSGPAKHRAQFLALVAREQATAGDRNGAQETFSRSLRAAETVADGSERDLAFVFIASQQVKGGELSGALQTTARFQSANSRVGLLASIARQEAQGRQMDAAREHLSQALETAGRIEDATLRAVALDDVAEVQTVIGDLTRALATAMAMPELPRRPMRLRWIAREFARTGEFSLALRTAKSLPDKGGDANLRGYALADIAGAQSAARQFSEALGTVMSIEPGSIRAGALAGIAGAHAKAGGKSAAARIFVTALEMAHAIENARERASALARVAEKMAGAEEGAGRETFARAVELAGTAEGPYLRVDLFLEIAQMQGRAGVRDGARNTSARALDTATRIEDADYRTRALENVARELARAGEVSLAVKAAEALGTAYGRASSLAGVAEILAESSMTSR